MAGGTKPGFTCQHSDPQQIQDGTLCLAESPTPGPLGLCQAKGSSDFSWGFWDVVVWKILPKRIGGDPDRLRNYKDSWVSDHRDLIKSLSARYHLPAELLGGVDWVEAGGKPYSSKLMVYDFRKFDHSGDPLFEPLTITKKPELTSMGPVAIQLRRAAEAMELDYENLSAQDQAELVDCLQNAENNLAIVAKHLWQLKQIDFPHQASLGRYEIRVIGARYNRGPQLSLHQILQNTSYGDFIVDKIYARVQDLLK